MIFEDNCTKTTLYIVYFNKSYTNGNTIYCVYQLGGDTRYSVDNRLEKRQKVPGKAIPK